MSDIIHKTVRLDTKQLSESGEFDGYASVFGNRDLGGDIMEAGAFAESLEEHARKGTMPVMFLGHDSNEVPGEWLEMAEDARGLRVKGKLWIDSDDFPRARQAYRQFKTKAGLGLSVGFLVGRGGSYYDEDRRASVITKANLLEVSLTPIPENQEARVMSHKSLVNDDGEMIEKGAMERALRDMGLSRRKAKAAVAAVFKTEDDNEDDEILSELHKALAELRGSVS